MGQAQQGGCRGFARRGGAAHNVAHRRAHGRRAAHLAYSAGERAQLGGRGDGARFREAVRGRRIEAVEAAQFVGEFDKEGERHGAGHLQHAQLRGADV